MPLLLVLIEPFNSRIHPSTQAAMFEKPKRAYMLLKAQRLREAAQAINDCLSGGPHGTVMAPEEAKRKRVEAAPVYLKGRVERDEALPEVEVRRDMLGWVARVLHVGQRVRKERLLAVVEHVVLELKPELVVELVEFLRPRWGSQQVQG